MRLTSGHHLTYCTNIHPGESWLETFSNLQCYIPALKRSLSNDQPFGIGLRLSNQASSELLYLNHGQHLDTFRVWLERENSYVFTLNGFPFGNFHGQRVKDQVYAPDWSTVERCDYTLRLVEILSQLLPAGLEGSISTLPLSYKPWFAAVGTGSMLDTVQDCYQRSVSHLVQVVISLWKIRHDREQLIHLGLEPEPDGLLENSGEVIDFFERHLLIQGVAELKQYLGLSDAQAEAAILEHIRLCYDTCHFALAYEQPDQAIAQVHAAGIKLSKIQLSSALRVDIPRVDIPRVDTPRIDVPTAQSDRQRLIQLLTPFAETTYLHQVVERQTSGHLHHYRDLDQALQSLAESSTSSYPPSAQASPDDTPAEWRIHFHVPIFQRNYLHCSSTQDHLWATLQHLAQWPEMPHLEIETYTWDVLPDALKPDLQTCIQREYEWVRQHLA